MPPICSVNQQQPIPVQRDALTTAQRPLLEPLNIRRNKANDVAQGVFTYLLDNLGVRNIQFEELLSLDPSALAPLAPVYGVIFLFKFPTNAPYTAEKPLDGTFDPDAAESLFFAHQTIQNACATQALLSVLLNKTKSERDDGIEIGTALAEFRDFAMALPVDFRGEVLSNSELIRDVHNSFARSSPFVDETTRHPDAETEDAFHFIAYTPINGTLYELDGLQPSPISHGACADDGAFAEKVMEVIQRRIGRYGESEIRFNLLAMCRDLRVGAREIGDLETLEREAAKRRDWQFENALRRHNFVGFAGEVLKGVVGVKLAENGGGKKGEEAYDKWVGDATSRMKKRLEDRQQRKAKGDEDVAMEG